MHPSDAPGHRVQVRRRPVFPAIVVGSSVFTAAGGAALVFGLGNPGGIGFLVFSALTALIGVLEFAKPYCVYDPARGELRFPDLFGVKDRVHGAPAGEHLYFDGRTVVRALPNGARIAVKTWPGRAEDVARMTALMPRHPGAPMNPGR
ncbi:hypothetical protein [Glycomyces terrestris]|uniref:Uncharacterized protein n=1 Tax=Glycomyces terrestris TaxID=2493553 RepID=A0A426V522_9ACTN|nr:hypothetical protein [Glycomyces terrestris]RRS01935.1 hypothetical protein EIW28_04100 [Glycomyces terrestris]